MKNWKSMMNQIAMNKIYSMISLAKKAGKVVAGSDACESALQSGKLKLLIVSGDASKGTRKNFDDACRYRNIPIKIFGDRNNLGNFIGRDQIVILGITDKGFSNTIMKLIDESLNIGGNGYSEDL